MSDLHEAIEQISRIESTLGIHRQAIDKISKAIDRLVNANGSRTSSQANADERLVALTEENRNLRGQLAAIQSGTTIEDRRRLLAFSQIEDLSLEVIPAPWRREYTVRCYLNNNQRIIVAHKEHLVDAIEDLVQQVREHG